MPLVKPMLNQHPNLDQMFHALADANRRAMLEQLSKGDATVSELAEPLNVSLPAVMQHLAVLEASGLIKTKKVGRVRSCTLDTAQLSQAEHWLNERRQLWNHRLDRLGEFLNKSTTGRNKP